jgi:threonine dehydrogenase-like Zn-dependent dehydrogenase
MAREFGIGRLIAVARSGERLEQIKALDPDLVDTIALDDLDRSWGKEGGLTHKIRELAPAGADVVIDFLPEGPGTWQAIAAMKMGGTAVIMGANPSPPPFPTLLLMINCWKIVGTRSCTRSDADEVARWLESGRLTIDDLITHRFRLDEIADAVTAVRERAEPTWMVVVNP